MTTHTKPPRGKIPREGREWAYSLGRQMKQDEAREAIHKTLH